MSKLPHTGMFHHTETVSALDSWKPKYTSQAGIIVTNQKMKLCSFVNELIRMKCLTLNDFGIKIPF